MSFLISFGSYPTSETEEAAGSLKSRQYLGQKSAADAKASRPLEQNVKFILS